MKPVIVQMFEWTWASIASECANLGQAGYGYVQVSPPSEHVAGTQWWTDYQPVSYTITSKRGTRAQFQSMVPQCASSGVGIIADTIWNHMTGSDSGTGVAGNTYTHYSYPSVAYSSLDFHYCGSASNDIYYYTNRTEVQTCELSNLADLKTESEWVRGKLAAYGNDLISLGVAGLRLDAAKHIPTADIQNILSRLSKTLYVTQEVIWGSGEAVTPAEYTQNGDVQESFRYATALLDSFTSGNIAALSDISSRGWVDSAIANTFVANHDTERNGRSLTYKATNNTYTLATIFSLAFPYGSPTILSSYEFTVNDNGAPNSGAGTCSTTGGTNGWLCQHRWVAVTGMVGFYNAVYGTTLSNWATATPSQIAFSRGSNGFIAINYAATPWSSKFNCNLPDGTYCNVVNGSKVSSACSGTFVTVDGGIFILTIPARDAVAIHTNQKL